MPCFRQKEVVVEAIQWQGFEGHRKNKDGYEACGKFMFPTDDGLEEGGDIKPGEWIVRYANGRLWILSAATFERQYEPIDTPVDTQPGSVLVFKGGHLAIIVTDPMNLPLPEESGAKK